MKITDKRKRGEDKGRELKKKPIGKEGRNKGKKRIRLSGEGGG